MPEALLVTPRAARRAPRAARPRPVPDPGRIDTQLQPILDLASGTMIAAEALSRFRDLPAHQTAAVFRDAHAGGYGAQLEAACLRAALRARHRLPAGVRLAVNVSPDVVDHLLIAACWPTDLHGVIIEVTEQRAGDPARLLTELTRLRRRGAAIAVDDAGAGHATLARIATLRPNYVKVDRHVTAGLLRRDTAHTLVLAELVDLAHRLDAAVIAEGVEHIDDLRILTRLDVDAAQGYALGRPAANLRPVPERITHTCLTNSRYSTPTAKTAVTSARRIRA